MKHLFYLLIFNFLFYSCTNEQKCECLGTWKLIATLNSDGGSEGQFFPVTSNKTISFYEDGVVTSNGNLCVNAIDTNIASSGNYNPDTSTFQSDNCNYSITYTINDNILIINYPSYEPSKAKYQRQ